MSADLGTQQDVDMVNAQPTELATLMELDEEAPDPNDAMEAPGNSEEAAVAEHPLQPKPDSSEEAAVAEDPFGTRV